MKLEHATLKATAFDALGLPITVTHGSVELIEFDIPWKSLTASPVLVRIKNLNIKLGPNDQFELSAGFCFLFFF